MPAAAPMPKEVAGCFTKAGDYGRNIVSTGPYMILGSDQVDASSCDTIQPIAGFDPTKGSLGAWLLSRSVRQPIGNLEKALRAVQTQDFMTAHWAELPHSLLGKVSNRIINEVRGINRVVYDISGKPPATIEWE